MTFDVLIFFDAIGNIRTLKVLVHFLAKNALNFLILPMASKNIRTSKIKKDQLPMAYYLCVQRPVGVRLGSVRLGSAGSG